MKSFIKYIKAWCTRLLNYLRRFYLSFRKPEIFLLRLPYKKILRASGYVVSISLAFCFILFMVPVLQELTIHTQKPSSGQFSESEQKVLVKQTTELEKSVKTLERKMNSYFPWSPFLVIHTSENKFYLYKNRKLYREGDCSTGSYILLESGDQQKWMFKTPKGKFRIQGKTTSPVWKKPDWAFVELGLPIPPENHYSRYEYGVLGDYALSLGHGYLIHGTLYKRFLGLPVTHGCVRLNDDDLEAVFQSLQIGSRVYIY